MKRFLALALSVVSVFAFATEEPTPPPQPETDTFDAGVLSYSIADNKIILNSDLDAVIPIECTAYDKDSRVFIDISRSESRASIWSTAIFDAVVSYRPLRIKLDYNVCDPKYGWRIADLTINNSYDEGSRHGVRLKQRNQIRTKFIHDEIRENIYGYPIEINVTGNRNTRIDISKDADMATIAGSVNAINSGDGERSTSMSMVVPSGYYYRVSGNVVEQGTIFK